MFLGMWEMKKEHTEKSEIDIKIQALILASENTRHADAIIQSRLSNFLLIETILFAAWIGIYASNDDILKQVILIIISITGKLIGLLTFGLGLRQQKFYELHGAITREIEAKIADDDFSVGKRIEDLRSGKTVRLQNGNIFKLSGAEKIIKSKCLIIFPPALFAIVFFIFLIVSIFYIH